MPRALLVLLILLAVLLAPTDVFLRFGGVSVADLSVVLLLLAFILWLLEGNTVRLGWRAGWFMMLAYVLVVSLLVALLPGSFLVESIRSVVSSFLLISFVLVCVATVRSEEELLWILRTALVLSVVIAVIAWGDALGVIDTEFANPKNRYAREFWSVALPYERSGGIVSNYSVYAAIVLFGLPLAWRSATDRGFRVVPRPLAWALFGILLTGVAATQARSTLLAGFVVILTLLWTQDVEARTPFMRRSAKALEAVTVLTLAAVAAWQVVTRWEGILSAGLASAESRATQYGNVFNLITQRPIGMGTEAYQVYTGSDLNLHSVWLNVLVSGGIVGLGAFVGMNVLLIGGLLRLRRRGSVRGRAVGACLLASFLGIHSEFLFASGLTVFHFWLLAAMIMASELIFERV